MKIYVVTHKKFDGALPANYEYFQVNAAKNEVFCPLNDAIGADNISLKNPNYCELTAAYWIWKNDNVNDIVGLAHYRRFFTCNRLSSSPKQYLNSPKVEKLLEKYGLIATKPYKCAMTVKEHLLINVSEKDFNLLRESVERRAADYLPVFDQVFAGHKSYLLNMFICKKRLWDEYYSWLFGILEDLEKTVDMTGYSVQQQRLYGFLAERLFTVYVLKNGIKVKSFPTHIVGESKWTTLRNKIAKILHIKKD